MTLVDVIGCSRCGRLLAARRDQKTRSCPYCGARIVVEKSRHYGTANNGQEALELLSKLKHRTAADQ